MLSKKKNLGTLTWHRVNSPFRGIIYGCTVIQLFLFVFVSSNEAGASFAPLPSSNENIPVMTGNPAAAPSNLDVSLTTNPDKVQVGGNTTLVVSITNNGNATAEIRAITLEYPSWNNIATSPSPPSALPVGETSVSSFNLAVPDSAKEGTYKALVLVESNSSDFLAESSLIISRVTGVSLSGELPFFALALIIPGFFTYAVFSYLTTGKFEKHYFEMSILSVVFGIISWAIMNYSLDRITNYDSVLGIPFVDYLRVAGISIGLGVAVAGIIYFIQKGKRIVERWKVSLAAKQALARFKKDLALTGHAEASGTAWVSFMNHQLYISGLFGREYAPMVRIYFKNPIEGRNYAEGLIRYFDHDPPYNIGLRTKYCVNCPKSQLLDALTGPYQGITSESSLFAQELENKDDNYYRAKTAKRLGVTRDDVESIIQSFVQRFTSIHDLDRINELLEEIDFSRFVGGVISRLGYTIPPSDYDGFVFVSGDSIGHIEVLKYDVPFAISIRDGAMRKIIPQPYSYSHWIVSDNDEYKVGIRDV